MKIKGIVRITKYAPDGVWVSIETPDLVGNLKAFIPGVSLKFGGTEHPFEMEITEDKPIEQEQPKKTKQRQAKTDK